MNLNKFIFKQKLYKINNLFYEIKLTMAFIYKKFYLYCIAKNKFFLLTYLFL